MPEFGRPDFTRPGSAVIAEAGTSPPSSPALPVLTEPAMFPPVTDPRADPIVPVAHRSIRVLSAYWHAGWDNAIPGAYLRSAVAAALGRVADGVPARYGLAVFDGWRPPELQAELYRAAYSDPTLPPGFVAPPDTAQTPPHLTGGTVDLTLTFDGIPLSLGTGFDAFIDAAKTDALEPTPGVERDLRRMLFWAMRAEGFVVLANEWWHFELGTPRWAALTSEPPRYGPTDLITVEPSSARRDRQSL